MPRIPQQRAMGLMELLVAVALLTLATLGATTVLSTTRWTAERDALLTRQALAANSCLSQIRAGTWKMPTQPGCVLTKTELQLLHLPNDGFTQARLFLREYPALQLRETTICIERNMYRGPAITSISTWIGEPSK
jgi:type II secretory pathway pseudopilin PulG